MTIHRRMRLTSIAVLALVCAASGAGQAAPGSGSRVVIGRGAFEPAPRDFALLATSDGSIALAMTGVSRLSIDCLVIEPAAEGYLIRARLHFPDRVDKGFKVLILERGDAPDMGAWSAGSSAADALCGTAILEPQLEPIRTTASAPGFTVREL